MRRQWLLLVPAAGLLLLSIVYLPVLRNGFVDYDDAAYVVENPAVLRGLSFEGLAWSLTTTHAGNWHPLTWLSHLLDVTLFGVNPLGHHLTSVALHAASAVLLLIVLQTMTGALWKSAAVAAIFLVHPLHVESVAWVAERKDVLSGFLFMLALLAYSRYARRPSVWRFLGVVLPFALGLMAKPMLVTFPFVLLLLDWWPLGRFGAGSGWKSRAGPLLLEKAPLVALSGASAVVTLIVQKTAGAMALGATYPLSVRVGNALAAYASYLGKTFYPVHLASFYPHLGPDLPLWRVGLGALLLAAASAAALRWRGRPYLLAGWLWFLGMLVPVIGIVQVGLQSMADRYVYIPLVGIGIAAAWGVDEITRRSPRRERWLVPATALVLMALSLLTWNQIGVWKNFDTLLANDLAVYAGRGPRPNAAAAGKRSAELERILEVRPRDAQARNELGALLAATGRTDEASAEFLRSIALQPGNLAAHYNLGLAYDARGLTGSAIQEYRRALAIDPRDAMTCNNLGVDLALQGNHDEAIALFKRALLSKPDFAKARFNLVKSETLRARAR